jgi:Flp pilus assembly protein TadD
MGYCGKNISKRHLGPICCAGVWILAAVGMAGQVPDAPKPQVSVQHAALADARRLIADGKFLQAKQALGGYLSQDDTSAEAHALLALTLQQLDDPRGSLVEYTKSAALERPSAFDLENVAKDYVLLGDMASAEHWAKVATELDPGDPEAWYALGRIRYTLQRFQEAADCFERSLVLRPRSVKAANNLGLSYEGLNREDDAVKAYRQAIAWQQTAPRPSEQPLLNLGIVLVHRGDLEEAQPLLEQAAAIAPNDARIREQLGHLYLDRKVYSRAELQLQAAIKLDPKKAALHFLLGKAYHLDGKEEQAKAEFAVAASLSGYKATPDEN